jgi:hypothetical protein
MGCDDKPEELRRVLRQSSSYSGQALSQVCAAFKIESKSAQRAESLRDSGGANDLGESERVSSSDIEWEDRIFESEYPEELGGSVGRHRAP